MPRLRLIMGPTQVRPLRERGRVLRHTVVKEVDFVCVYVCMDGCSYKRM